MKLISAMLVVKDINQSVDFYETVLGLKIISDFGANKTLSGGLALQTLDSYKQFIETDNIRFGGNNSEIYFEVDDFDEFAEKIKKTRNRVCSSCQRTRLGTAGSALLRPRQAHCRGRGEYAICLQAF